jgi:hypothetical protein
VPPAQITVAVALIVMEGRLLTETDCTAELVQPPAIVPVTEYTDVDEGFTVMLFPVAPVLQL